jgi:hypothetical protein
MPTSVRIRSSGPMSLRIAPAAIARSSSPPADRINRSDEYEKRSESLDTASASAATLGWPGGNHRGAVQPAFSTVVAPSLGRMFGARIWWWPQAHNFWLTNRRNIPTIITAATRAPTTSETTQFRGLMGFDPAPFCAAPSPNQNRSLPIERSAS